MKCAVKTCKNHQPRKGATVAPDLCVGHALLLSMSKESRADFIARQERQDEARRAREAA